MLDYIRCQQTFAFEGEADGIVSVFHLRLLDETRIEFDGRWTGKDGKIYLDMKGTAKRREGRAAAKP